MSDYDDLVPSGGYDDLVPTSGPTRDDMEQASLDQQPALPSTGPAMMEAGKRAWAGGKQLLAHGFDLADGNGWTGPITNKVTADENARQAAYRASHPDAPGDSAINAVSAIPSMAIGGPEMGAGKLGMLGKSLIQGGMQGGAQYSDTASNAKGALFGAGINSGINHVANYGLLPENIKNWSGWANVNSKVNQLITNSSWLKSLGVDGTKLDGGVLQGLRNKFKAVYGLVRNPDTTYTVNPDDTSSVMDAINAKYTSGTDGVANSNAVRNMLAELEQTTVRPKAVTQPGFSASDGMEAFTPSRATQTAPLPASATTDGGKLGEFSSKLGAAARLALKGDKPDHALASGLFEAKDYVDQLLDSKLSPTLKALHAETNQQYKTLYGDIGVENPNNVNLTTGNINGKAVASNLQSSNLMGLAGDNQSQAYEAARLARGNVGDSTSTTAQDALSSHGSLVARLIRTVPGAAQYLTKYGLPMTLKALQENPRLTVGAANMLSDADNSQNDQ